MGVMEDVRAGASAAWRLAEGATLREVIDVGAPAAWTGLDAGVRAETTYYSPFQVVAWEHSEGGRALTASLRKGAPLTASQLAVALCHRDGRVRAAALDQVDGCPEVLPLVVVRCADWAEPVRDRARRRLEELLDTERAVTLLPVVLRVGRRERGGFAAGLVEGLLRGAPRDVLTRLSTDADRAVRRYGCRLAVEQRLLTPAELAHAAARDTDAVVQTLYADAVLAAARRSGAYDDVLGPLLGARSPRVRSAGVTALRPAGRPRDALPFLTDRSGLVRACARYVVRQGGTDPLAWYRTRCAAPDDPALPPGAAIGLAECGQRADAELLWPLLAHPAAAVRAQAVAGLRVLDTADVRRLWPLLDDPAPGVVREVTLAVLPSAELVPGEWLAERLDAGWPRHVRLAAFRLLLVRGEALRQRALLAFRDDPDGLLRERAARAALR
ncbi:hypothetical protein [Streptomyces canus]|uniref:hypothetical protein n=1 Tax=Streptomyces canus TaxID=58343 RepID=UPI003CF56863